MTHHGMRSLPECALTGEHARDESLEWDCARCGKLVCGVCEGATDDDAYLADCCDDCWAITVEERELELQYSGERTPSYWEKG